MSPKMTVKDLSMEVEKLKQSNVEKDALIKAEDEKFSSLHQWQLSCDCAQYEWLCHALKKISSHTVHSCA